MTKSHFARSTFLRLNHYIRTAPIFLFLLPVFFVLHGFIPNYEAVYPVDALRLTFLYFIIAIVLGAIGWIIYHDILKAAILAFILMAYHFFFGVIRTSYRSMAKFFCHPIQIPVAFERFVVVVCDHLAEKKKKTVAYSNPLPECSVYIAYTY